MEKNTEKQEIGGSSERENCVEIKGDKTNENPLITGRLLITGDTHGDQGAMTYLARLLREGDCLFVAGDFGYIFLNDTSEKSYLRDVNHFLVKHNCYLVFVDGNHENHPALSAYPVTCWNGARCHKIGSLCSRIIHVCRGEILKIYKSEEQTEPIKIWCFGGAFSIDRQYRKLNESYWEEELPTDEDYVNSSKNLEAEGYQIDFGITHTCPLYRVRTLGCYHAAREEEPLQNYFQWVCDKLNETNEMSADGSDEKKGRFKRWYFGHWHTDWNQNWLEVMHLEELPQKCRAIYLDLEDMETGEVID